ncbi:MAG: HAMP domain-containing protein, partial [Rhizobiales bacterium]|nr:HAMP domain-containing protein [Hyphomicrobiales bacterium]
MTVKNVADNSGFFSKFQNLGKTNNDKRAVAGQKPALFSSFKIATRINSLVVMAVIAMAAISAVNYYKTNETQRFLATEKQVEALGDTALNLEKEFLQFSLKKQEFFIREDIAYADEIIQSLLVLMDSLEVMKNLPDAGSVAIEIDAIIESAHQIHMTFNELVKQQTLLGFNDSSGLHKKFVTIADALETTLIKIGGMPKIMVALSNIRRYESAYLDTHIVKNIGRIVTEKSLMTSLLYGRGLSTEVRKGIGNELGKYVREFKAYAKESDVLAEILVKFNDQFAQISPKFESLNQATETKIENILLISQQNDENLTTLILSAVGFIMVLIISFGWLISRSISKPLARIVGLMARSSKGEIGLDIPATSQKDEVGDIARALEIFDMNNAEVDRLKQREENNRKQAATDRSDELNS